MALQYSVSLRNAQLDAIETTIGTSPTLEIRSGSPPANAAAADSGTVLATISLPSDWLAAASSGSIAKSGTWSDTAADATGTAGHWRIKSSGGTVHMQGTCTATDGGGDMTLDNTSIAAGQTVTVTSFSISAGNA